MALKVDAMELTIDVPRTTMLADVDETLRTLLDRELRRHDDFEDVDVRFDAPSEEWSAQLAAPTVNVFLHDLREAGRRRIGGWEHVRENGDARDVHPPLVLDCLYTVTAWTQPVEREHRLLSQLLAILNTHRRLPADTLQGQLGDSARYFAVEGRVATAMIQDRSGFWNAVGGRYRASLDYTVTLALDTGVWVKRGAEVRTQTIVTRPLDAPRAASDLHRVGGRVLAADGQPVRDAWVALPDHGRWTTTDAEGRFRLARVPEGRLRCITRAADGREVGVEIDVPERMPDLVLGDAPAEPGTSKPTDTGHGAPAPGAP